MSPEAEFVQIASSYDRCFWLDGGGRGWSGRRSLLGWLEEDDVSLTYDAATQQVTRHCDGRSTVVGDDVFAALEAELAVTAPDEHWVGYFGYASRPDLPATTRARGDGGMPDAVWMRTRHVHVIDHSLRDSGAAQRRDTDCGAIPAVMPAPAAYADAFAVVQEQLHAGNTYEVNLTHRVVVTSDLDPAAAYLRLRAINPAPYAGFLQHRRHWLLSSSPERYATIGADRMIETKPIKGTTPRGSTLADDVRLKRHLATDPKFRAENLMIVDLLRNDIGMISDPGTVRVPRLMEVESYPSVHQLVSTVRGHLRDGVSTVGGLRALFPAGSMTGAPKLRTMEVIRDVETTPRGVYSGAFGWIGADGRADLGVVIRSLTTSGDGRWEIGTGGGITVGSDIHEEYAECQWKIERLLRIFGSGRTSASDSKIAVTR